MHKRLLISALVLVFIAFLAAQISQRQHTFFTGNTVAEEKTSEDLFLPQQEPVGLQNTQQAQQQPRTAFGYIVRWVRNL